MIAAVQFNIYRPTYQNKLDLLVHLMISKRSEELDLGCLHYKLCLSKSSKENKMNPSYEKVSPHFALIESLHTQNRFDRTFQHQNLLSKISFKIKWQVLAIKHFS